MINNIPEAIEQDISPQEAKKDTSIHFGWMREGHYFKNLYRDVEIEGHETKPGLYVIREEYPSLWKHMEALEQLDLQIEGVMHIILRFMYESINDNLNIEFYANSSIESRQGAGLINIFELTSDEVVELVKSKVAEAQDAEEKPGLMDSRNKLLSKYDDPESGWIEPH